MWSTPTTKTINQESAQLILYKDPTTTKALNKMTRTSIMIPICLHKNQIRTTSNKTGKDLTSILVMTPDTSSGHRVGHRLALICNRRLLLNNSRTLCLTSTTQATRFPKEARSLTAASTTRQWKLTLYTCNRLTIARTPSTQPLMQAKVGTNEAQASQIK